MTQNTKQKLSLLDCTLRDGGYQNNWHFGEGAIADIVSALDQSGVEYIELGFLETGYQDSPDFSKFSSPIKTHSHLQGLKHAMPVCMLRADRMDVSTLPDSSETEIQGLRYLFSVDDAVEVVANIRTILDKGYKLFLQPFGTKYADMEALEGIIKALPKGGNIAAVYVVDTYGNMTPDECHKHVEWLDQRLDQGIAIGVHLHDNCGLAMANVLHVLSRQPDRHLMIDSCITGYGLGAGNLKTEEMICNLPASPYNIAPLLGVIQNHFPAARSQTVLLLAAILNLHPKYGMYLLENPNMSIRDIYKTLQKVPDSYRKKFDDKSVEEAFAI